MKDTHFCFAFIHDPGTYHGRKKVMVSGDIKGMKIRPAQSTIGQMVTMMGGTNVQASAPRRARSWSAASPMASSSRGARCSCSGLDKVTKYHIDVPLYSTVFTYSMNKAMYDAMSPAQKKVIDDHCTGEWAVKLLLAVARFRGGRQEAKMKALSDHEVYTLTPDQLKQWQAAVAPLKKAWAEAVKKTGQDPEAIYKGLPGDSREVRGGVLSDSSCVTPSPSLSERGEEEDRGRLLMFLSPR